MKTGLSILAIAFLSLTACSEGESIESDDAKRDDFKPLSVCECEALLDQLEEEYGDEGYRTSDLPEDQAKPASDCIQRSIENSEEYDREAAECE